jgi:ABC-2 type transport system ATP-binding protein
MIQVRNLAKYYGEKRALGPVSFEIKDDECVGFLGLNGAGKTTALRILACDLVPSAGAVSVDGIDAVKNPHEVRKQVGFLPEWSPLYPDMTVEDYLVFAGRLRGMSRADVTARLPEVTATTHVDNVRHDPIGTLSHGYRQRVGLAQAIVHKPRLLILDEPTRGLDPVQIVEMRNMIRELKKAHTVLVSSHVLTEISETCDRLLVLGDGEIIGRGTEEELSTQVVDTKLSIVAVRPKGQPYRDESLAGAPAASELRERVLACIRGVAGVVEAKAVRAADGALVIEVAGQEDLRAQVCRALVEAGHDVVRLDQVERKLEAIFLQLVHGGNSARH